MQPRILVPYDFSPSAERALQWAADLRRSVGGGTITLILVVNYLPLVGIAGAMALTVPCEADVEAAVAKLRNIAADAVAGSSLEAIIGSSVGDKILSEATAQQAELIVMGTHGHSMLKQLLLGSVAQHVVRNASCPVVTIHG